MSRYLILSEPSKQTPWENPRLPRPQWQIERKKTQQQQRANEEDHHRVGHHRRDHLAEREARHIAVSQERQEVLSESKSGSDSHLQWRVGTR